MTIDWWTLALQVGNFLILVWLLQRFLYKPVVRIIARRKEETERAFAEAEAIRREAEAARKRYEVKQGELLAERDRIVDDARARLARERDEVLEETRREAEALVAEARARIDQERRRAVVDLDAKGVDLAVGISERLLRDLGVASVLDAFLERAEGHLDSLPAYEFDTLRAQLGDGAPLCVLTAPSLDGARRKRWRERLRRRFGDGFKVEFSTDDSLISGIELRFPRAILRFAWRDSLARARKGLTEGDAARHDSEGH
jgi:F-type H+-transporting ATPase subunit b